MTTLTLTFAHLRKNDLVLKLSNQTRVIHTKCYVLPLHNGDEIKSLKFCSENGNRLTEQFPMRVIVQRSKWFFILLTKLKKIISTNQDQVHQPIVFCPTIQKRRFKKLSVIFFKKKTVSDYFLATWQIDYVFDQWVYYVIDFATWPVAIEIQTLSA